MSRVSRAAFGALVALTILLVQLGLPSTASAQVPDDTPLRVRWVWAGPVTFCADTSMLPAGLTVSTFRSWIQEAIDAWNRTDANVELRLTADDCTRAAGNLRNEVGFEVYDEDAAEVGRAYSSTQSGVPVEGDVTLRLNWETQAHCRISALVHEFGHVLGFSHSEFETDVMGYGPCAVLQPSDQEVGMLAVAYGARQAPLDLLTPVPDGTSALTLQTTQVPYTAQDGAFYFNAYVGLTGGGAHALRAVECFTADAPTDEECTEESSLPAGFWPAVSRQSPLGEVFQAQGQTVVEPASQFGHFARQVQACNAVGCAEAFGVRAGDVRVTGSGVDFAYLVYATPDGQVSVQVANVSFFVPPTFLDVSAAFEVRQRGVSGAAGLLGACERSLGQVCEVKGAFAGMDLEILVYMPEAAARSGVWIQGVEGLQGQVPSPDPSVPAGVSPISGTLPAAGFTLALWGGGPVTQAAVNPSVGAIFVSSGGVLRGYVVGAPAFVNSAFLAAVGTDIPAGTPVVVVVK